MDHRRKLETGQERASFSVHPRIFVFFDKSTGNRLFEVKACEDGRMPREQAVSLLAIHCVARQQMPDDFRVMVATGEDLVEGLAGRAIDLIRTCTAGPNPSSPDHSLALTQRQNEVLACIAQNLCNKEIAARLNISERTVKFHVSTLLRKYHVRRRVDLILEAFKLPVTVHKREACDVLPRLKPGASGVKRSITAPLLATEGSVRA